MRSIKKIKFIFTLALLAVLFFQAAGTGTETALAKKSDKSRLVLIKATVTAINGTEITARTKAGKTRQVEIQNAKLLRRNAGRCAISEMAAGDKISVWGTESGGIIAAKKIKDISLERVKMEGTIIDIDEDESTISFAVSKKRIQTVEVGDDTKITYAKVRKSNYPNLKATVFGIRSKTRNVIYNTTKIIVYSE